MTSQSRICVHGRGSARVHNILTFEVERSLPPVHAAHSTRRRRNAAQFRCPLPGVSHGSTFNGNVLQRQASAPAYVRYSAGRGTSRIRAVGPRREEQPLPPQRRKSVQPAASLRSFAFGHRRYNARPYRNPRAHWTTMMSAALSAPWNKTGTRYAALETSNTNCCVGYSLKFCMRACVCLCVLACPCALPCKGVRLLGVYGLATADGVRAAAALRTTAWVAAFLCVLQTRTSWMCAGPRLWRSSTTLRY